MLRLRLPASPQASQDRHCTGNGRVPSVVSNLSREVPTSSLPCDLGTPARHVSTSFMLPSPSFMCHGLHFEEGRKRGEWDKVQTKSHSGRSERDDRAVFPPASSSSASHPRLPAKTPDDMQGYACPSPQAPRQTSPESMGGPPMTSRRNRHVASNRGRRVP